MRQRDEDRLVNAPTATRFDEKEWKWQRKEGHMKKEYDFSKGKRGAVIAQAGKTRITIYLDDAILKRFKAESQRTGKG
jgi:hypothetical protein